MTQTVTRQAAIDTGRPVLPARSLLAVAAAGAGFAAWLPDSAGPGLFLVLVGLFAGLAVVLAGGVELTPGVLAFAATGSILVSMTAIRDAGWLLGPDLLLALVFAALAVTNPLTWTDAMTGVVAPSARLPEVPGALFRSASAAIGSANPERAVSLARGLLLGGVLVSVFWALFASADRAFAQLTENLLPDWDLGLIPMRIILFVVACTVTTAFVLAGISGVPRWLKNLVGQVSSLKFKLGRVEWIAVLGMLNVLFLAFAIVQIVVLFQGHDHILKTAGLTYAEYAREGFFQLLFAAALTIPVVSFTWTRSSRNGGVDEVLLKVLLGSLCLLMLGIVVSALRRLGLYEEAFGFTRARLAAHAVAIWLGALLLAMVIAGAAGRTKWLFYTTAALTAFTVIGFNLINPDAAIAKRNWQRYLDTEKIDTHYLSGLSADAIPYLAGLRSEVSARVLDDLKRRLPEEEPWSSANLSRIRARSILGAPAAEQEAQPQNP
jgi:uncharacterized protein DUF4153